MIDRSYLPYDSVRLYQDRGMAKWMGFFISEHSTVLQESSVTLEEMEQLPLSQKLFLLNQLFIQQLQGKFLVQEGSKRRYYIGRIKDLSKEHLVLKEKKGHVRISMDRLLAFDLEEEE
ncbi:TPA: hypothetical protein U0616_000430 [Streptococcus suis]|nr:hypothetical protein [Streptococcus suis]HEM6221025.1 hypothetical protein [Streptococcus suis]